MNDDYLKLHDVSVLPRILRFLVLGSCAFLALAAADAIELPEDADHDEISPGVRSFSWEGETAEGPVAIRGFYWPFEDPELSLVAAAGRNKIRGTEETSRQAERLSEDSTVAVAAVNADFFIVRGPAYGSVHGPFIRDGELLSLGVSPVAAILEDGSLAIEKIGIEVWLETDEGTRIAIDRVNHERGDNERVLYTSSWDTRTATSPEGIEVLLKGSGRLKPGGEISVEITGDPEIGRGDMEFNSREFVLSASGAAREIVENWRPGTALTLKSRIASPLPIVHAVGGLPVMIREGEVLDFTGADPDAFIPGPGDPNARHPRTAIGTDGDYIVALVVDGRAPGYSLGMTVPEVAEFMRDLGCTDAINLDGGGSTTLWAGGEVLNRPSDGTERPVGNALVLISREP